MRKPVSGSVLLVLLLAAGFAVADTWLETTGPDFADGRYQANLYASMRDGGAVEFVPRFDYSNDGWIDVACPDDSGPYLHLHLGSLTGFNTTPAIRYEIPGGGGVAGADLDCNGFTDLVHSGWITGSVVIYWGTAVGPSQADTTWLTVSGRAEAVHIHDLDRDSYLDIIVGNTAQSLQIFWGSDQGYSNLNQTSVQLEGSIGHNLEVADFDQDGWADIAAVPWTRNLNAIVYWGPNRTPRDTVWLPVTDSNPHGITTADLDTDGWLDLVYTHYDDTAIAYVYYGGPDGFTVERRETIHPGLCYGGSGAAYWDSDSTLDLVFFRGNFGRDTLLIPRVYYNNLDTFPHFSDNRAADIGATAMNASGGLIADFNRDGDLDIYLDGYNEGEPSYVLWGPGWTTRDTLACDKSHHGIAREPGNIYDRRSLEEYTSSVFDAGSTHCWLTCSWDDSTPGETDLAMHLRTGDTQTPDSTWTDWLRVTSGNSLPDSLASRYIQYTTTFTYETPAILPLLEEVRIDHIAWPRHDVGATAILAPVGAVDSGTVHTPRAVVHNFGNRDETFPTTFRIGPDYDETTQSSLQPGGTDTLNFPDWTALVVGTFNAVCFTALAGDEKSANDTVADTVRVLEPPKPDVGPTRILAPAGSVDSGTVILPRVEVRNYGPFDTNFPVTLRIGADYDETVSESLLIGQTDTVEFPEWTAPQVMTLPTLCFTSLAEDGNRLNDTIADSIRITRPPPPDVGVTEILALAGAPDSGDVIAPRAVVHNFGRARTTRSRSRIGPRSRSVLSPSPATRNSPGTATAPMTPPGRLSLCGPTRYTTSGPRRSSNRSPRLKHATRSNPAPSSATSGTGSSATSIPSSASALSTASRSSSRTTCRPAQPGRSCSRNGSRPAANTSSVARPRSPLTTTHRTTRRRSTSRSCSPTDCTSNPTPLVPFRSAKPAPGASGPRSNPTPGLCLNSRR
jgi:hypothetical protein